MHGNQGLHAHAWHMHGTCMYVIQILTTSLTIPTSHSSMSFVLLYMYEVFIRLWQIIPKRLPIILFFYSQIMSPLFFQTKPIILNYSYFS